MMYCWKCGHDLRDLPKKISFRAQCDACTAWLHTCRNCCNYKPGLPNDCLIPGTEYIADREACNFCEEFKILGKPPIKTKAPDDVAQQLFKEDTKNKPSNKKNNNPFDNLFLE